MDALEPLAVEEHGEDEATVTFSALGHARLRAHVRRAPTGVRRALSCTAGEESDPGRVELLKLTRLGPRPTRQVA